jgi:hypothetical protein
LGYLPKRLKGIGYRSVGLSVDFGIIFYPIEGGYLNLSGKGGDLKNGFRKPN